MSNIHRWRSFLHISNASPYVYNACKSIIWRFWVFGMVGIVHGFWMYV